MAAKAILGLAVVCGLLLVAGPAQGADLADDPRPRCSSPSQDPDGDGYGWENAQTCINLGHVTSTGTSTGATTEAGTTAGSSVVQRYAPANDPRPICSSSSLDPDRDGYGWENNQTCVVRPICSSASMDLDGDGYGWENGQTCLWDWADAAASTTPTEMQTNPLCAACHTPSPPPAVVPAEPCDGCVAPDFTGPPLPPSMDPDDPTNPNNLPPDVEDQYSNMQSHVQAVLDGALTLAPDDPTRGATEDALLGVATENPNTSVTVSHNHDGTTTTTTTTNSPTNQHGWSTTTISQVTANENNVPVSVTEHTMTFDENNQIHHSDFVNQTTGASYSFGANPPDPSTFTAADLSAAMGDPGAYGPVGLGDVGSANAAAGDFGGYTADSVAHDAGTGGAATFGGLGSDSTDADCGGCGATGGELGESEDGSAEGSEGGDDGGAEAGPGGNGGV